MNFETSQPKSVPPAGTAAQKIAFGVLALCLVLLGLVTLWHFLSALVWAAIFAIALWPLYHRANQRWQSRHTLLLPGLFTLMVALVFIIPVALVGLQLSKEAYNAADWVRYVQAHGIAAPDLLNRLPAGQAQIKAWWAQNLADPGHASALVSRFTQGHMATYSRSFASEVVRRTALFLFTILTLFFLFKEGEELTRQMRRGAARAFGPRGEVVGRQIIASVHGTVTGLVLVGLSEGVILGIFYAVAGVPHPTVLGAFTAVAAMIPLAAGLAFGLAALLLLAKGSVVWAISVLVGGFAVTFTADHAIRPALIGGATKLPFLWVLLGILGGVESFGLIGLFLGPAIMASLILLWREWAG